jgi:hypothetical protein
MCFDKLARDQDIANYIDAHESAYPVSLQCRITPIPYKAKGYTWQLLNTTNGGSMFREYII